MSDSSDNLIHLNPAAHQGLERLKALFQGAIDQKAADMAQRSLEGISLIVEMLASSKSCPPSSRAKARDWLMKSGKSPN